MFTSIAQRHPRARSGFLVFMLFCCLFLITYGPALYNDYLVQDDYNQLGRVKLDPGHIDYTDVSEGRLLASFFSDDFVYRAFGMVENAKYVRLIMTFCLALLAFLFYRTFMLNMPYRSHAILLALCVSSLFPFHLLPLWVNLSGSSGALFMSLAAAFLYYRSIGVEAFRLRPFWRLGVFSILTSLLQASALLLYEPFAMIYWTMPAIFILQCNPTVTQWKKMRLHLAYYGFLGFVAIGIRMELPKLVLALIHLPPHERAENLISTVPEAFGRLKWFISEPLIRVINFWNYPLPWVTLLVSLTILLGIVYRVIIQKRAQWRQPGEHSMNVLAQIYVAVGGLIILAYLPNLMQKECLSRYRTFIGFAPIMFLMFYDGIQFIARMLTRFNTSRVLLGMLGILSVMSLLSAANNTNTFVYTNTLELRYMLREINNFTKQTPLSKIKRIYVQQFIKGYGKRLEFDYASTPVAFGSIPMTRCILLEMGYDPERMTIMSNQYFKTVSPGPDLFVLDMRGMRDFFTPDELQ